MGFVTQQWQLLERRYFLTEIHAACREGAQHDQGKENRWTHEKQNKKICYKDAGYKRVVDKTVNNFFHTTLLRHISECASD